MKKNSNLLKSIEHRHHQNNKETTIEDHYTTSSQGAASPTTAQKAEDDKHETEENVLILKKSVLPTRKLEKKKARVHKQSAHMESLRNWRKKHLRKVTEIHALH
eukprot:CAMPEP_0176500040 /NCGR_PEP_ID=MMETSP0200_2-20121128/13292_1 /TAXON_ID=947934 /ORGANISM="Chaetoceros sp., Strain GSL56" /LENGTH=103 /DNA_ID=CAMNT_0017898587 /DNA_START=327 /DNA_END=638 /DNA_ORIENTATION=-